MARVSIIQHSQSRRGSDYLFLVYTPVALDILARMDIYCKTKASKESRSPKYAMLERHIFSIDEFNFMQFNLTAQHEMIAICGQSKLHTIS